MAEMGRPEAALGLGARRPAHSAGARALLRGAGAGSG
jgi:hypothetical protein